MKRADVVSGAVLFVVSAILFYQSSKLEMVYGNSIPGTGFLPYWLSLAMVLLSLILIVNGVRSLGSGATLRWPPGKGLIWIVTTIGALAAYTMLATVVGYIISTFAFLLVLVRMLSSYRWHTLVAFSLAVSVGLYAIFGLWLQMTLPTGFLIIP